MKLSHLKIEGFRRVESAEIFFGDTTFLIGENNLGKSSILYAIETLLSATKKLAQDDFCAVCNDNGEQELHTGKIVLTARFTNLPREALCWRGFKGRILRYDVPDDSDDTGLAIFYRKIFEPDKNVVVAMKSHKRSISSEYSHCRSPQNYIDNGVSEELIHELFGDDNLDKNLRKNKKYLLEFIDEIWDVDEDEEDWFENPGGIMQNVLSHLPNFLLIPAQDKADEISNVRTGTLAKTMLQLFRDVREKSKNYRNAQKYLKLLEEELDPTDETSEFGTMIKEINDILGEVFPESKILARANLSDPDKALKPGFDIEMASNVVTPVNYQGTGMIRSAVFALLRYRKQWEGKIEQQNQERDAQKEAEQTESCEENQRDSENSLRPLIIGFEEPEIYLHPNAANQLRDTIYDLATSSSQIVCTTHSPYMIDLTKPEQVLNNFTLTPDNKIDVFPFNISEKFKHLSGDEKTQVKMVLKFDDYVSRVFFAKKVVIVEGDTEEIVLRETIHRIAPEIRKRILAEVQIIRARGKATIISLVKYLRSMGIDVFVIHDRDQGTPGAEKFNPGILTALDDVEEKRVMLEECIEDVLGYPAPSSEKPYTAYKLASEWGENWSDVPETWRSIMESVFSEYFA
jgi:predicted ATP-dependent endonuclease of OLD family